jgi:WS/DGAT/MGAT family acyltransferase
MKQLSGLDALFLQLETPEMPMHVGSLNVYELPAGFRGSYAQALRHHVAARLPITPALRRRLWWMPLNLANPAWVDAEPDLPWHIVEHKLPRGSDLAALEDMVGTLHPQLLDRSRPLWRFHVIDGLAPGRHRRRRVAVYTQLHHAAVDGQAAVALATALLDLTPEPRKLDLKPSRRPRQYRLGMAEMLRGALLAEAQQVAHIVRDLPGTLGTLGSAAARLVSPPKAARQAARAAADISNITLAPHTPMNVSVTTGRAFAAASLPLAEVKSLAKAHGATLNDIVLMLCGSALRRYLFERKCLPRRSLVAAVPISLRAAGDTRPDNQASMSAVSLGTHLADPMRRLAHVMAASAAMKATMAPLKRVLPTDVPSIGVPWLVQGLTALYSRSHLADKVPQLANVVISNVPGPPATLYLAGARMLANYPTSIVVHGIALNITLESYDQSIDFGLMADRRALPDVRRIAAHLHDALAELRALPRPAPATPASAVAQATAPARKAVRGPRATRASAPAATRRAG